MCEISFDDLDGWKAWIWKTRRARKPHVCECCDGAIPAGGFYLYLSGIDGDRNPFWEKCCLFCRAAQREFEDEHDFGSTTPSYFATLLNECFEDDSAPKWGRMLAAMDVRALARQGISP